MAITALAPWFGSNRMLAPIVGQELSTCSWVGIPFVGGMSELMHIMARTILVSDIHRHVMNLACVISNDESGRSVARHLSNLPFHPDTLKYAQGVCLEMERGGWDFSTADAQLCERWAVNYFICCWMGRSNRAGTADEFSGSTSIRWNSNGGDSAVRYQRRKRTHRRYCFVVIDGGCNITACQSGGLTLPKNRQANRILNEHGYFLKLEN